MGKPLSHIKIQGYKSIRDLSLELRPLNVLIGANGAGKSNFISIFTLLRYLVEKRLQLFVGRRGADSLLYFGSKQTEKIGLWLTFGPNGYACDLATSLDDTLIFEKEWCSFHNPDDYDIPYQIDLGQGHLETNLATQAKTKKVARHVLEAMQSWWVYHFHDTSSTAKMKLMTDIDDNRYLKPDGANLPAYLYWLQETAPPHYRRLVKTIRLVAPFFEDFALRPNPLNPDKIRLEWREKNSTDYFNAHYLSDGTLRFICLATLLLQPAPPTTIVIDEPELGLHPYAITLLASLLRKATHQTQVIVSTQSVPLVNQFGPDDIIVVNRQDDQSTFSRCTELELAGWLEEYGMGDLWERNILGGRPT